MSSVRIELTPEGRRALEQIQRSWRREEAYDVIERVFSREAQLVAAHAQSRFLSGQRLKVRTGSLRRSIVGRPLRVNGMPAFAVGVFQGPARRYAAVQEFGTKGKGGLFETIRPRRAKTLAIPQDPVLTPAGVPRYASPRDYPGELDAAIVNKGNLVGFLYDPALPVPPGGDPEPLWFLVRKVDIRPKRFLRDAMEARLPKVGESVSSALVGFLEGGRRAG